MTPLREKRRFKGIRVGLPALLVVLVAGVAWALNDISVARVLVPRAAPVVILTAADGSELAPRRPVRGPPVARADLPRHLVDAVLAIEDQRFFSHWGIDPHGILRAFVRNLDAGAVTEGGSTITQQLVKVLSGEDQRSLRRKLREAVLAIAVERRLTKDQILTRYLDNVYFGAGVTGVTAAARVYFGKEVKDLSLAESALLAGLIRAPSDLNPLRNLPQAHRRAGLVLDAMAASGRIDRASAAEARRHPALPAPPATLPASGGSWFADWAYEEVLRAARASSATASAVRVRTTMSPRLQAIAERVVAEALARHGKESGVSEAALVAMRSTGEVVAMVGGRSYRESQFNRAVHAARQPGSTFKLFVYFAALRNGYSTEDRISDSPIRIGSWRPRNYNGRYHGRVTLSEAFARSLNAAAVRLSREVGIDEVIAAARTLGIDAPLPRRPSLALGAAEVSLLDLTGAYAAVLAGQAPVEPSAIAAMEALDPSEPAPVPARPAQESLGSLQQPLIGLLERVVAGGTGRAAALGDFTAGKTGTTESYRDAWFIGFTRDLVAGVWVGNDNNAPMRRVTGGKIPAAIWREFMAAVSEPEPAAPDELVVASAAACDIAACGHRYRSFRASECTFQPYDGERRLCTIGLPRPALLPEEPVEMVEVDVTGEEEAMVGMDIVGEEEAMVEVDVTGEEEAMVEVDVTGEEEAMVEMDIVGEEEAMFEADVAGEEEAMVEEIADAEIFTSVAPARSPPRNRRNGHAEYRECTGGGAPGSKARDRPGSSTGCRGSSM